MEEGKERRKNSGSGVIAWYLVFDGRIIPEHCFKTAFSQSVSLVDLQGHCIKGPKFAFVHNPERKMILSDTEGSRVGTQDDLSP